MPKTSLASFELICIYTSLLTMQHSPGPRCRVNRLSALKQEVAKNTAELKSATAVRGKENADYKAAHTVSTLINQSPLPPQPLQRFTMSISKNKFQMIMGTVRTHLFWVQSHDLELFVPICLTFSAVNQQSHLP